MNDQQNNLVKPILVIVAVFATITVNVLASALPINGMDTGEISDRFDILFVPARHASASIRGAAIPWQPPP